MTDVPPIDVESELSHPDAINEWVYFVHGITAQRWQPNSTILAIGFGEFGIGFYTFADTKWGREAAGQWAQRKAAQDDSAPIVVQVRIALSDFILLQCFDVADDALDEFIVLYKPDRNTGYDLIIGSVGKNDAQKTPRRDLLKQYKFEENGVTDLEVVAILRV